MLTCNVTTNWFRELVLSSGELLSCNYSHIPVDPEICHLDNVKDLVEAHVETQRRGQLKSESEHVKSFQTYRSRWFVPDFDASQFQPGTYSSGSTCIER